MRRVPSTLLAVLAWSQAGHAQDTPTPPPAPTPEAPAPEAPSAVDRDAPTPAAPESAPSVSAAPSEAVPAPSVVTPPEADPAPALPATATPASNEASWTETPLPAASDRTQPAAAAGASRAASEPEAPVFTPYPGSGSFDERREPRRADRSRGLLGPFRVGPVVGVGLPNLLSIGGTLKLTRYFGAGVNFGLIPEVRVAYYGDATLSYQEYDVYARLYPFGGGFFLGAGVGYARARGTLRRSFDTSDYAAQFPGLPDTLSASSEGTVQTMVLTPQLGYFQIFDSGFSFGVDLGAQLPIAPSEIEFDTRVSDAIPEPLVGQYLDPGNERVRDTLETIGRTPLPTINLRLGWLL